MQQNSTPEASPLGKTSSYIDQYDKSLLFPIARKMKRDEIDVPATLPFQGYDIWHAYEVSWLNGRGKPEVAIARFTVPCESTSIIESKSFKLYLNSFNQTKFENCDEVSDILKNDLSASTDSEVNVELFSHEEYSQEKIVSLEGLCLDELDVEINEYQTNPKLLRCGENVVSETLYSHLLKSNCLVTGQPDWGSVWIEYTGPAIDHESLLKYLISFRNHNEFHEQCVERIFMDLTRECKPEKLTVVARYTRRGGLDINPFRSNYKTSIADWRLTRQ